MMAKAKLRGPNAERGPSTEPIHTWFYKARPAGSGPSGELAPCGQLSGTRQARPRSAGHRRFFYLATMLIGMPARPAG